MEYTDGSDPLKPCQQIFALRYENLFCEEFVFLLFDALQVSDR